MGQAEALLLTVAVEVPALCWLARATPVPAWRVAAIAAGASCLTHPVAWHVAGALPPAQYAAGLVLVEATVVAIEALAYRLALAPTARRALAWSACANALSFAAGWILQR
jgi:hypothetical protein